MGASWSGACWVMFIFRDALRQEGGAGLLAAGCCRACEASLLSAEPGATQPEVGRPPRLVQAVMSYSMEERGKAPQEPEVQGRGGGPGAGRFLTGDLSFFGVREMGRLGRAGTCSMPALPCQSLCSEGAWSSRPGAASSCRL